MEATHTCSKCKKPEKIRTFFAHQKPIPDDPEHYEVEQEWICTDCMTNMMASLVAVKMQGSNPRMHWFPLHSRISLEFEDEQYGSFSIRVWNGEHLFRDTTSPYHFGITGIRQFVFIGENLTRDESAVFAYQPPEIDDIPTDIKKGMDIAIANVYSLLK